ncbi:MAG: nitrous oxide reductase family maturation protein NosD, partial [Promethearchaeota archaeon]
DHFGISFDEGCHNNLIIGNIVDGNTETGINLGGIYTGYYENNFNNISNNIVTKNFYGGITTGGLGNNFSGNYIFNNTEWGTDLAGLEDFGNYTIFSENVVIGNYFYLMGWYSILHNNIFINVSLGISSWFKEQTCSHTISVTNTVNDGILYYYANKNGLTNENFTGKVGQIIIANCNNSLISELSLSNWSSIRLYYSCYNTILNINLTNDADIRLQYSSDHNFITNCYFEDSGDLYLWTSNNNTIFSNIFKDGEGVLLIMSHYNNLTGNIVINTDFGILISSSNYTIISENYISNNNVGITLDGGGWDTVANNNITNNIIENNKIGIKFIAYSQENLIRDNSIINSSKVGIHIEFGCNNNLFYRNAFIKNNRSHAWDEGDFNQWDNGIIGNYWDNYTERGGFDNNNDGIGDINYTIYDRSKIFAANDTKPIFENPIHNGEKIYIDGTGVSALNWTQTVLVKYWCTGSGKEQNPYIIKNLVINGSGSGNCILIANSSVFFTIENCKVFNCSPSGGAGIRLESVNNSLIIRNNCSDNNYGIILSKCYDNLIHDNSIFKKASGERYGIYIEYSNKNNITNNLIYDFSGNAFGSGIDLFLSNYSFVKNNIVFNHRVGISIIFYGIHNNFSGNIIYNNSVGLVLKGKYNTAYNNTVKFNSAEGGIYISGNNNTIIMNNVYNNTHGIWVTEGYNNTIIHNSVSNNTWGIDLRPDIPMFPAVKIYENYIKNNSLTLNEYGVVIWKANFTVIYMNIISYNTEIGILIDKSEYSTKNLIYFNSFIGNKIHAIDNGTTNYWNSSVIGNYWDNYTGVDDLAPFGIGDTPHNITGTAGSKDYLPIYKGSGTTPEPEPTPSPTDGGNGGGNGGDGKEEFDIIEFLTSPVGITVIGSSIAAVAVITIIKKKGSGKSRVKEIERIERIRNE